MQDILVCTNVVLVHCEFHLFQCFPVSTNTKKTFGATKQQYYHKIISLSVVEGNKIGEPCKEYGRGIICCTTSAPIKFYLIAPWFLVDERNE